MDFWIDIENSTGVRYGPGPIRTATGWRHTPRLDGAGDFSFSMPASDPMSRHLANKRIVRCWGIKDGKVTELGAGIIDKIALTRGTPSMLTVSGPDIMAELAGPSVHGLVICEQAWSDLTDPLYGKCSKIVVTRGGAASNWEWEIVNCYDGNDATGGAMDMARDVDPVGFPEANKWFYVGADARWDAVDWTLLAGGRINERDSLSRAQYYNGSGWVDETIVSDGTMGAFGRSFEQSGIMTFVRPPDWTRYVAEAGAGDWYWRRFGVRADSANEAIGALVGGAYIDIAEVKVYADIPTTNGVNLIMAYAPDTWTKTGYPATVSPKYLEFRGQTVLEALAILCEQGGTDAGDAVREHFRLGTGRAIDWMGTTVNASGVRAVAPTDAIAAEGAPELALIQSLKKETDSAEVVTRIFPLSADQQGIGPATDAAPTGYTRGSITQGINTFWYLQHTAGYNAYGLIERWVEFSELRLQQPDSYTTHPADLGNALQERGAEYLRTHALANQFYRLSIVQFPALILPGDTIECVYHEWIVDPVTGAVHTVDIDTIRDGAPLHVLAPTLTIDGSGVHVQALEVATIDRAPKSDAGVVVDLVRQQRNSGAGASNLASMAASSGGHPPAAGADIRVSGYRVSRAGAGVLLYSGSGALLREYAADAMGLAIALAQAASGDIVEIPAGTITGNFTIPAGVTLKGIGWNSVIGGYVTLGVGTTIANCKVYQSVNTANDIVGISGPGAAGECYVRDVFVELIQAGAGKALGLLGNGTGRLIWSGSTRVRVNGGTGSRWAVSAADGSTIEGNHGNVKAWIGA